MLIFIAGYTDNCDWNAAEQVAAADYWTAIEFSRAGKITTQQIAGQDRMIRDSYASTIESGSSLVVYAAVDDQ